MIFGLFRGRHNARLIERLHDAIVAAARAPVLFTDYGLADDLDGRFESITLHAVLLLRRLRQVPPPGPDIAQDLADAIFRHFDRGLREAGVSDIAVPRRMRDLAEAFLGRAKVYNDALDMGGPAGQAALAAALARNVFGGAGDGARLAALVGDFAAEFARMPLAEILEGPIFRAKTT
jgi:cytochrome b pre-mRNA-processing protein 3